MPKYFLYEDDNGASFLCINIESATTGGHVKIGPLDVVPTNLVTDPQPYKVAVKNIPLSLWFKLTQDVHHDKILDWIIDNVSGKWCMDHQLPDNHIIYSFNNEVDAVAFKLSWVEQVID
jgi:hypothetical protein